MDQIKKLLDTIVYFNCNLEDCNNRKPYSYFTDTYLTIEFLTYSDFIIYFGDLILIRSMDMTDEMEIEFNNDPYNVIKQRLDDLVDYIKCKALT